MPRWSRSIWRNWAFVLIWLVIAGSLVRPGGPGSEKHPWEMVEAVTNETFVGVAPGLRVFLPEPSACTTLCGAYPFLGANVCHVGELGTPERISCVRPSLGRIVVAWRPAIPRGKCSVERAWSARYPCTPSQNPLPSELPPRLDIEIEVQEMEAFRACGDDRLLREQAVEMFERGYYRLPS